MAIYLGGHKNDVAGSYLPEMNKYPPTNKDAIIAPPDVNDWRKKKDTNTYLTGNAFGLRPSQAPPGSSFSHFQMERSKPAIIAFTFKKDNNKIAAVIKGELCDESTMLDVMNEFYISIVFDIDNITDCNFLIKKKSNSYLTMKHIFFVNMTVDEIVRLFIIEIRG